MTDIVDLNNPFLNRGGNYNNGDNAGVFNSYSNNGNDNDNNGFRTVCTLRYYILDIYILKGPEGRFFKENAERFSIKEV